jgi:hypothetical protein
MYRKCYNKCCKNGALLEAMPKMENCVSTAPVRTNQGSSPPENHTKNKTNSTCEPPRSGYCFLSKKSQKILEKCPHLAFFLEILMAKLMVQKVDRKWTGSGPEVDRTDRIPNGFRPDLDGISPVFHALDHIIAASVHMQGHPTHNLLIAHIRLFAQLVQCAHIC